jgi:putative transposase
MLQEALFERLGDQFPKENQLQFLHNNGPKYIEKQSRNEMKEWNIEDCSTPTC